MSKSIVSIKGTSDGLIFYFNTEEAGFGQLCATLEERLQTSGDFFINADYIIDEESKFSADELKALDGIMAKYHLIKGKRTARVLPSDDRQDVIYQTVGGNSMEPQFHNGDMVLVSRIPDAPNLQPGEVGAFITGNETYIKVYQEDGLYSLNPDYRPMHFEDTDPVYLIGRVMGILDPSQVASEADVEKYRMLHPS